MVDTVQPERLLSFANRLASSHHKSHAERRRGEVRITAERVAQCTGAGSQEILLPFRSWSVSSDIPLYRTGHRRIGTTTANHRFGQAALSARLAMNLRHCLEPILFRRSPVTSALQKQLISASADLFFIELDDLVSWARAGVATVSTTSVPLLAAVLALVVRFFGVVLSVARVALAIFRSLLVSGDLRRVGTLHRLPHPLRCIHDNQSCGNLPNPGAVFLNIHQIRSMNPRSIVIFA